MSHYCIGLTGLRTNSTEISCFREANIRWASQEGPRIPRKQKVYWRFHKNTLMGPVMNHMNLDHILTFFFFVINYNVILSHLPVDPTTDPFHLSFLTYTRISTHFFSVIFHYLIT
jgi:hypothetical protein